MAGVQANAVTGQVALAAATLKTVLQIVAAANHRVLLWAYYVSFEGVVTTDAPVFCELLRQSTAGTMSALTPVKVNDGDNETLLTTALHTATAEPTAGDVLKKWFVHPQGRDVYIYPLTRPIVVLGGARLGIRFTAANAVDCIAGFEYEE